MFDLVTWTLVAAAEQVSVDCERAVALRLKESRGRRGSFSVVAEANT
jgi:hypothetical protein